MSTLSLPALAVLGSLGEMLAYPFMQRAFLAGICVALVAPLVGSFLVHRQMAMIGETLAHTAFAGVALGLFLGTLLGTVVDPTLTALVVAVLAALLIEVLSEHTDVYNDVSMMVVLAGGFALGSVLIGISSGGIAVSIDQYLFGSIATLTRDDVLVLLGLTALVVGVVIAFYRDLVYVTFDEAAAHIAGVHVVRTNRLLVTLTALVVVGAMQLLGVILVAAMLVIPVAAAAQVAGSFKQSLALAVAAAQLAVITGTTLSYTYDLAAGGTIVLVAIAVFLIAAATRAFGVARRV